MFLVALIVGCADDLALRISLQLVVQIKGTIFYSSYLKKNKRINFDLTFSVPCSFGFWYTLHVPWPCTTWQYSCSIQFSSTKKKILQFLYSIFGNNYSPPASLAANGSTDVGEPEKLQIEI